MISTKINQLLEQLFKSMPPTVAAQWEYKLGLKSTFNPYGGPFNNQTQRLRLAEELFKAVPFSVIIETGIFRGVTTEFFAKLGLPIYAIEVNERYLEFCKLRLKDYTNVQLIHGDSGTLLESLIAQGTKLRENPFLYLDAHWYQGLPLEGELNTILSTLSNFVVMIDDFKVPGDKGYDYYIQQKTPLDIDLLRRFKSHEFSVFFPAMPSDTETGYKMGCALVARGSANVSALHALKHAKYYGESSAL